MKQLTRDEMKKVMGGLADVTGCSRLPNECSTNADCKGEDTCQTIHCDDGDFLKCRS